jgi:8-oxo-dGTP diphosphatase
MGVVVAAAIVRSGLVLAAHRTDAGWEFPGGKVEAGESESAALTRECNEELGVVIEVDSLLATSTISAGWTLHLYACALLTGSPRALLDHSELRWVGASALEDLEWLPADRPLLPAVVELLSAG